MKHVLVGIGLLLAGSLAWAAPVELHFFWSATCPLCQIMKEYLAVLAKDYPELKIISYEVSFNADNWRLMVDLADAYNIESITTPMVFVGNVAVAGVGRAVELRLQEEVERCVREGCPSPLNRLPENRRWRLSPIERLLIVLALVGAVALALQLISK